MFIAFECLDGTYYNQKHKRLTGLPNLLTTFYLPLLIFYYMLGMGTLYTFFQFICHITCGIDSREVAYLP